MSLLIVTPIVAPLLAALAGVAFRERPVVQRLISLAGPLSMLGSGLALLVIVDSDGIQATNLGDWPAPFGIVLVADLFSAFMLLMAGIVSLAALLYSFATLRERNIRFGHYSVVNLMLVGVSGAFLTGDMFNLFVWFELMLIASFVLLALGGGRRRIEGAVKYVAINLLSSAFFLSGAGLLYASTGTLNMADLSVKIAQVDNQGLVTTIAMFFVISFGLKSAAFPMFFWLPASYHTPSIDVTALFSGLLTKVGVYALIRTFTLVFANDVDFTHTLIMVLAGFTMVVGVIGAIAQYDYRRLLSFHIVSQIGYMLMGLSIFTPAAIAGAILFMAHNILVKTSLFLVGGLIAQFSGTESLNRLGDMYRSKPMIAALFAVAALSLAGLPPSSGFISKLALVRAGIEAEAYVITGISLFVSLLTLYSMIKIWNSVFWRPAPQDAAGPVTEKPGGARLALMLSPALLLIGLSVVFGFVAQPVFELATAAAESLIEPSAYVDAVLGETS